MRERNRRGITMNVKRTIAAAVALSLAATLVPATAWAKAEDGQSATPATTTSVDLRGSTDRALSTINADRVQVAAPPKAQKTGQRNAGAANGGGGGGAGSVMAIVGIAMGIATTYFVIKEMHKTESDLTAAQQPASHVVR
jgi:hypothetical protein